MTLLFQITSKYGRAVDIIISSSTKLSGQSTFVDRLEESIENKSKTLYRSNPRRAQKSVTMVGLLIQYNTIQYNYLYNQGTVTAKDSALAQENLRLYPTTMCDLNPDDLNFPDIILEDMETYTKQREDIDRMPTSLEVQNKDGEAPAVAPAQAEALAEADEIADKELNKIQTRWQFLFEYDLNEGACQASDWPRLGSSLQQICGGYSRTSFDVSGYLNEMQHQ